MKSKPMFSVFIWTYVAVLLGFVCFFLGVNRSVTTFSEKAGLPERKCIIIDAGHGGEDGGATSCTGILESQINLEVAQRLNDLLQIMGMETLMIRTVDVDLHTQGDSISARKMSDLRERVRIINEKENAILISIHQNTFSDSQYKGSQVFYSQQGESEALAKCMQTALVQTLDKASTRKSKKANGIYLMEHVQCTGILLECGFISNPEEEALLRSDQYQKNLCSVVATTISRFLYA